jgi:branched-chain amino acid transport system substrate-binding protein
MQMRSLAIICFFFFASFLCGCSKDGNGEYITIGALLPLTGEDFDEGLRALNGLQLAKAEINENGGILGKKLNVLVLNDKGDEEHILRQYNVLKKKGVAAIVGSSYSGVTKVLAKEAAKDGIPVISPTASNPEVTKGHNNVFRAIFIDDYQAEVMAKFARRSLKAKTAVVLYNSTNSSFKQAAEIFAENFKDYGGQVVAIKPYISESEYKTLLKEYRAKPPGAVYCPEDYVPAAKLVNTVFELGMDETYVLGSDSWDGVLSYVTDPNARKRVYYTSPFSFDDTDPKVERFVRDYFSTFAQMPLAGSACAYTSMYILAEAIKKAGNTKHDNIVHAMKESGHNTIIGHVKFDKDNNPHTNVYVIQIRDGIYSVYEKIPDEEY